VVQTSVTINAVVPVTETAELYGYANLSRRQADAAATWRTAYTSGTTLRTPLYPQGFSPNQASVGKISVPYWVCVAAMMAGAGI
jgi:hypothetical protein